VRDLEQEVQRQRADAERHAWQLAEATRRAEWLASERETLLGAAATVADTAAASARREAEHARALDEIRRSWSWRLTMPLRTVAGWWRRG
jgi:hypothetical protein